MAVDARPTIAGADDDPHLWLEEIEGARALAWVDAQSRATTRKDDRVHPGHARKMAAKLQAMGYEAYFYEPAAGGHGYGKYKKEVAAFVALGYEFLRTKIGFYNGAGT